MDTETKNELDALMRVARVQLVAHAASYFAIVCTAADGFASRAAKRLTSRALRWVDRETRRKADRQADRPSAESSGDGPAPAGDRPSAEPPPDPRGGRPAVIAGCECSWCKGARELN